MADLAGKVALITGASRGTGRAIAERFVSDGAKVVVANNRREDEGRKVAEALGDAAAFVALDVREEDGWAAAVSFAQEQFGSLSVLVNNAGIVRLEPLPALTLDSYREIIEVNQVGVFLGMRAVLEPMTTAGGGSIVNISSIEGFVGAPGLIAYAASKHAVDGMTKCAALELAQANIRVNCVNPGGIDTDMLRAPDLEPLNVAETMATKVPLGRLARADEIAGLVSFLASDDASYCTGSCHLVDGGILAGY